MFAFLLATITKKNRQIGWLFLKFKFNKKTSVNEHLYLVRGTNINKIFIWFDIALFFLLFFEHVKRFLFQFTFLARIYIKNVQRSTMNLSFKNWSMNKRKSLEVPKRFFFIVSKSLLLFRKRVNLLIHTNFPNR